MVELHDAFTIAELLYYEALGLAPHGEAVPFLNSGATRLGGRVPVNPSGGLLAKGHPLGATGVAQMVEIMWQLQGRAGSRQVEGASDFAADGVDGIVRKALVAHRRGPDGLVGEWDPCRGDGPDDRAVELEHDGGCPGQLACGYRERRPQLLRVGRRR